MSQAEVIHVKIRQSRGKHQARRLRAHGEIPAVLYGHGEATESLTIPAAEIDALLRHGGKVVQLQGEVNDSALVREVQWDSMGGEVLHLDFTRVSSTETVETTVRDRASWRCAGDPRRGDSGARNARFGDPLPGGVDPGATAGQCQHTGPGRVDHGGRLGATGTSRGHARAARTGGALCRAG